MNKKAFKWARDNWSKLQKNATVANYNNRNEVPSIADQIAYNCHISYKEACDIANSIGISNSLMY